MPRWIHLALALTLTLGGAAARAQAPSDASIERLLAVTQMEHNIDQMMGQMEQHIRRGVDLSLQGKPPLPEPQRRVLDRLIPKMVATMREDMSWAVMKPIYLEIYRGAFTQEEVDGMIAFYLTPAGQSTIRKLPLVMQQAMQLTQQRLAQMTPRLEAMMKESLAEAGVTP